MIEFLKRRWFLLALVIVISTGQLLGSQASSFVQTTLLPPFGGAAKSLLVGLVLLCMSVTLDGRRFRDALLRPLPVILAIAINIVMIPLGARLLMPLQLAPDFAIGLLIAAAVPCTLAAASVWTRRAGGNDAVSLLATMLTNGLCFLYTPFWLKLFSDSSAEIDPWELVRKLLLTAMLPIALGQMIRLRRPWAVTADRAKVPLGVVAQAVILVIVFVASCEAGLRFGPHATTSTPPPGWLAVAVVVMSAMSLHLAAMIIAVLVGRILNIHRENLIAVAFAASQKTLPIGVLIATDPHTFGTAYPWAVYPMLIFHAGQLFIDTTIADRVRSRWDATADSSSNSSTAPEVSPG
ncbi:MAG: bile acid:sodium symporter [Planctomycetaceae bacterium]